ncbi:MAG: hypothetical protein ACLPJW_17575 [Rhodomicrobium sp.]
MSAIQDLQAAQGAIDTAITASVATMTAAATLLTNLQNGTVNADDPAVEAVVADLNKQATALGAANTALGTAVTPPAAAAPSGSTPTS